jgi:glyoxylate/hydroxypyruvate reductase A
MGLGELGGHIASFLPRLGYTVSGWARSAREIRGVAVFSGEEGFEPFLAQTDVLVCLLPLTPQTRGILNARTFAAMPKGSTLIHCGRGEHLVEADLLAALDSGQLRGAVVDVFEQEPLPPENPLWQAPGVVVTPHMATMAAFDVVAAQIARNVAQLREGAPFFNQVDTARGY